MHRTNKETVKAHLNLVMGHLTGDWDGNKKIINSLQYALRAVDAYRPKAHHHPAAMPKHELRKELE